MPQDGEDQIWDGQPKVVVGRIREGLSFAIAVDHVSRFAKLQSQIVQGKHGLPAQFFSGCDPAVLENERTHIDSRRLEAPHKKKKKKRVWPVRPLFGKRLHVTFRHHSKDVLWTPHPFITLGAGYRNLLALTAAQGA